ncbi:hypothetical protein FACS1894180_0930 [Bacteroidia bacterium]|nr:hypothetical protein FACS1894180_0930 [Bacteroidia bacterium]
MENYPTPEAAGLGEFGKIPVNLYSGTPAISIPLYEVKEGNVMLPVSLNYNLSSVKPNNHTGWTGLGWNLSAGGCITRNVRGVYDEKLENSSEYWGFYANCKQLQKVNSSNDFANFQNNYTGANNATLFELMTDEYNFNFGQYSGSFYLNEYGQWVVVSDDDIKVEFDEATGFRKVENLRPEIITTRWGNKNANKRFFDIFTLVTPDGKRYTFGGENATEYSINYYNRNGSDLIATTWYLTKIRSPEGFQIILDYEAGSPVCEIMFSAFSSFSYADLPDMGGLLSGDFLNSGDIVDMVNNTVGYTKLAGYLMFPVYLNRIYTSLVSIGFHSTDTRSEQETLPYEDFLAWGNIYPYLNNVTTPFSNEAYTPAGQFGVFMPAAYGHPCEISKYLKWRTLKGITINPLTESNFTKTYYLDYERNSRKKLTRISEQKGKYQPDSIWVNGGWYDCERGVYSEHLGQILILKTPTVTDYVPKEYLFNYNTSKVFPRYIFSSIDHWGYYNGVKEASMEGERSFSIPYTFDRDFYNSRNATSNMDIAQAETLKEIIYPTGGKTTFTYQQNRYSKIVPPNLNDALIESNGTGGGLCVSEINNYDETNRLVQTKKYYYADNIPAQNTVTYYTTSGILKSKKQYVMNYNFSNGYYAVCSEGGFMSAGTNQSDPYISYSSVIEQTIDGDGNSNGYTRYKYTNFDTDIWGEKHMDRNYKYSYNLVGNNNYTYSTPVSSKSMERGKIVSEEYFNTDNQLVKSVKYKYTKVNVDSIKAPLQDMVIVFPNPAHYTSAYFAFMNYIYTYRYLVSEKTETEHNPANGQAVLTSTQTYSYNEHNLLSVQSITQSNGIARVTRYAYPFEMSTGTTDVLSKMTSKHILSNYVEKYETLGNDANANVISAEHNNFAEVFPNIFKVERTDVLPLYSPVNIRTWYALGSAQFLKPEINYKYDEKGNVIEIKPEGSQIPVTYLWGYNNQYPIAEIVGATYEQVKTASGFNDTQIYSLSQNSNPTNAIVMSNILRSQLSSAQITTYTYKPLIGMTSMTDPAGVTTYYEYDSFGRLQRAYIKEGNVEKTVERYNYHYKTINN